MIAATPGCAAGGHLVIACDGSAQRFGRHSWGAVASNGSYAVDSIPVTDTPNATWAEWCALLLGLELGAMCGAASVTLICDNQAACAAVRKGLPTARRRVVAAFLRGWPGGPEHARLDGLLDRFEAVVVDWYPRNSGPLMTCADLLAKAGQREDPEARDAAVLAAMREWAA